MDFADLITLAWFVIMAIWAIVPFFYGDINADE